MAVKVLPKPEVVQPPGPPSVTGPRAWLSRVRLPPLFTAIVIVPVIVSALYLLLFASPRYVSEAKFVVREPAKQGQSSTGVSGLVQTLGLGSTDETYDAMEWIMSRDALADLMAHHRLREKLARPGADILQRFPWPFQDASAESLHQSLWRYVSVDKDSETGIGTLRVTLFSPADSREVAQALLAGAEELVNRLNERAAALGVAEQEKEVADADRLLVIAENNLNQFRGREGMIDPSSAGAKGLDLVTKITEELVTLQAERAGLAATAPNDPQLPGLDSRIKGYQHQIDAENARLAGEAGSLAPKVGLYEQLQERRDFAAKFLEVAQASLQSAVQDVRHQRQYLEHVAEPSLPDRATVPNTVTLMIVITVSCLLAYVIISLVVAGFSEHRQS